MCTVSLSQGKGLFHFWYDRRETVERQDRWAVFIAGALLGGVCFFAIFGAQVLNPCNVNWIYTSASDFSQAQNGWVLYRNTPWTLPLGYVEGIFYHTNSVTVISTDSIPIFAVLFKLLSPFLPATFQYFGIWELMCYCLQGGFGALLLRKKITNNLASVFGAFFLITASWFITRVFGHCALSGQFIILAAWCLWAYETAEIPVWHRMLAWGGVCSVAILIAPYFVIMTGGMMAGSCLEKLLKKRKVSELLVPVGSIVITAAVFAMMGGFFGLNSGINNRNLGQASLNLNAWYNSFGRSKYLSPLPMADIYFPSEGFQYLGLGILCMTPFVLFDLLGRAKRFMGSSPQIRKQTFLHRLPLLIVCMAFLFFSAFPDFYVGDQLLFSIQLPDKLYKLFDIFQSNGRFFWVISYGYTAFALVCYARFWERFRITRNILPLMLIPVMVLHWTERLDLTNPVTRFTQADTITHEQTIFPQSGIWDEVLSQADYLDFLWGYSAGDTQALVPKAVEYGVKLNMSQAARQSVTTVANCATEAVESLLAGSIPQNKIYVIQDVKIILPKLLTVEGLRIFYEDGYYLAVPSTFTVGDGYEELTLQSVTPAEYGAYLGGLDENRAVLFTSYHNAEDNRAEVMQTIAQAAGCQGFPVTFGNEFAGILLPASRSLAAYESDSTDAVLTLEAGSDLCGGVLPVSLSLVGKTDFYDDTNLEIGATLNGRVILQPGATGVTIYVFNFQTGIVESAAWISLDGTTLCNLKNFNFPIA